MTVLGDVISVQGKRPEWWRDGIDAKVWNASSFERHASPDLEGYVWAEIYEIKLPADHWVYTVLRYNEQHGTNFTPWGGGERAPDDWDEGNVLMNDPVGLMPDVSRPIQWTDKPHAYRRVIGYTRRVTQLAQFTEQEAREHGADNVLVEAMRTAGLLREPTPAERFKNERGNWALLDRSELIDCVLVWATNR